jgi:hypothetical protein
MTVLLVLLMKREGDCRVYYLGVLSKTPDTWAIVSSEDPSSEKLNPFEY